VNDIQLTQPRVLDDSLTIRKVAELPMPPIRIAAENNGKFYVSAYFTNDGGQYGGVIYKYEPSPESELYSGRIVSSSHVLYRPFGLAVSGDELYVSRSGHAAWANHGEITDKSCGAITCLRDLDCDGYFEYMNDIARDLPGAGGPDTMHQNNGIAIHDDDLYVALAMNSDRDPDERVNSGTVLKVNLKNGRQEVVAEGFRNPFGIAVNSVGDIFVTDNDPGDGHGDELNYVIRGEHYGHPYVTTTDPPTKASGFQEPIFISDPDSNFAGIAFASGKHVPASLRNRLLLCDFGNNRVLSLALERKDGIYKCVDVQVLATVHTPVDISVAQDGVIYVASRFYKAVYAIEPKEQELYQTE